MATVRRERYANGVLVGTEDIEVPDEQVNEPVLQQRATAALVDLRALADTTGALTSAQLSTAVRLLARAVIVLARLHLRRLEATD